MEKVSIIVPVYKVESYLERCVNSLTGQTYPSIEIILVDDGSPDKSGELCDKLAQRDSRIVVIHQENQGVSAARNAALDAMTGNWVCFCDGDDWYAEDYVEQMLACANKTNADYLMCDYYIANDKGSVIRSNSTSGLTTGCDPKLVIACTSPSSSLRMIKRELFEKSGVRYPVGCTRSEELPVIPLLATYAKKIGIVDKALYYYYQRSDGSSASNSIKTDFEQIFFDSFNILKQNIGAGYDKELEYLIIYALLYGQILDMCKQRAKTAEIKKKIAEYTAKYPEYSENPYLSKVGIFKQLFIWFEKKNCIPGLRILAYIHRMLVH